MGEGRRDKSGTRDERRKNTGEIYCDPERDLLSHPLPTHDDPAPPRHVGVQICMAGMDQMEIEQVTAQSIT